MKKLTFTLLLSAFALTTVLPSCSQKEDQVPVLLARKKVSGPENERALITETYTKAKTALDKNPGDLQQYINIASAFIAEGRVTGNNNYYGNAAVKMLNTVIESNTPNKDLVFQSLSLKSAVLLNMHQFTEALKTAQQGVAMNSYNSGIYGALVDAYVETGNYDEAVKACDKMISIRPDLRSYSRASYLRQIFGENAGAIAAMKMAVDAGVPGEEQTEWARTTLGDLYLNMGNTDSASIVYRSSLVYRPDYPYALIGMARVEKARKNYDAAIAHTKNALNQLGESAFVSLLADLYELKGDKEKAVDARKDVINLMEESMEDEEKDALVKHNISRELATAYMSAGKYDKALQYALEDLKMRPSNIDANELAGWIYYRKGEYATAKTYADKMLVTKTKNATTLYKAGSIYARSGEQAKGDELIKSAMDINPSIDPMLLNQTKSLALTKL
ncbi:MAG: tetratricopeptide repeat protein [Bacteroidota bacterium]